VLFRSNKGISTAFLKLLKRFAEPAAKTAKGVNVLGLTPLDFSANDNGAQLRGLLENDGFELVCSFLMDANLSMVRLAAGAEVNLVVSQSGWAAAKYLGERFGLPYVAAVPLGREFSGIVMDAVKQTAEEKRSRVINGAAFTVQAAQSMLIVGDQVIANSLRAAIYQKGFQSGITVASFFALEPELSIQGDIFLSNEKQLIDILRSGRYAAMIADPLITGLPAAAGLKCHSLPHPAVSSSLYWDRVPLYISDEFENTIQSWIDTENK
jgi:nitrogenase molybdenum-iron protein alpha/beta subunit